MKQVCLLWKYNDAQGSLYFDGTCVNPHLLLIELYQLNERLFDGHHAFTGIHRYRKLLQQSGGLFHNGPVLLLEQYALLLSKYGLQTSLISVRHPTSWNGREHVAVRPGNVICWISNNYVIGESI